MTLRRRTVLTGLASTLALPVWAQGIRPQSDPYGRVDPYADPRNGFNAPSQPAPPKIGGNRFSAIRKGELTPAEQEEVATGRLSYQYWIKEGGGAVADPRLQQALRDFCRPLFEVADRSNLPWQVTLVANDEPNASAGPGGMVIVHTGMLKICDRQEDLLSVLGHEIGHVDKRHSLRGRDMEVLLEKLKESGFDPLNGQSLETLMPETQGLLKDYFTMAALAYSRSDESEADLHAIEIFERLGLDTRLAGSAFEQLYRYNQVLRGGEGNVWVRSHPLDSERVANVKQAAALRSKGRGTYDFPGWDVLKAAYPTYRELRRL